ncbi:MAG TPA: hypothetical protein VHV29_11950 [Terriglobales bacterium]|jgi:hypothetical protein|nr:hypothetical protein [Terriglobales bacterium]
MPVILVSIDDGHPVSEAGITLLINPQGCALRIGQPIEVGRRVRLDGLPVKYEVTARVANCISFGKYEGFWLIGLALDEPGNVWGVENPPADWHTNDNLLSVNY